ncbi:hypothetical protein PTSG_11501, partial [Salpingoeca rosetta]
MVYARTVETALSRSLRLRPENARIRTHTFVAYKGLMEDDDDDAVAPNGRVLVPIHPYSQLCQHADGAALLKVKGHLNPLIEDIMAYSQDLQDAEAAERAKAALWACAHVGSTPHGLAILPESVPKLITSIAEQTPILSMRGVCMLVLSLFGSHAKGAAKLHEIGWTVASNSDERYNISRISVAFPKSVSSILKKPPKTKIETWTAVAPTVDEYATSDDPAVVALMSKLAAISNAVLNRKVMAELIALKRQDTALFSNPHAFVQAYRMIAFGEYNLAARRQIDSLFLLDTCLASLPTTLDRFELSIRNMRRTRSGSLAAITGSPVSPTITRPSTAPTGSTR